MRVVLQRVRKGSVSVDNKCIARIDAGYVILLGIGPEDDEKSVEILVKKIALLRVFEDEQGKMNKSILDIGGAAIVVSQFTLYADTRRGNRPSFSGAAHPDLARRLVDYFAQKMAESGIPVQQGEFGAEMQVEIHNDGPVTILLEN